MTGCKPKDEINSFFLGSLLVMVFITVGEGYLRQLLPIELPWQPGILCASEATNTKEMQTVVLIAYGHHKGWVSTEDGVNRVCVTS